MKNDLAVFEGHEIRRHYDEATETWWFSVVDIVQVLTQQPDYQTARKYWNKLKERLGKEGSQLVTNCHQLKMPAADGKSYLTDAATAETLLRLVQSVPSPKAEPIKLWLAKTGYERMQELADPVRSLARARETWQKQGRSAKWIEQRMTGQETRNKLTDYWAGHEIKKGDEFAILTNIIHQEWSTPGEDFAGMTAGRLRAVAQEKRGIQGEDLGDVESLNRLIVKSLQRYNDTTIQRYNDTTIQRYNDTTIQRYNDTTIQRYNDTTIQRYNVRLGEVQEKRELKQVPGGLKLHQYANLYFHARNPMLYKRKNEVDSLCVLRISKEVLQLPGVVLADCNASSPYVRFLAPKQWALLDFEGIYALDWNRQHANDPHGYRVHKARKCAEVLVPHLVETKFVTGAYVVDAATKTKLQSAGFDRPVTIDAAMFFR